VDLQFACQCGPRHRQHGGACHGNLRRRRRADSVVALPDLGLGTVSGTRRCGRRSCGRVVLFRRKPHTGRVFALITVQTNLTIAIATGLVGRFGPAAIAGYGTGSRLEYLLIPLVFGLGGPLVALVGTNIGAGQHERALRAAWIGAAIAAGLCELIGLCAAMFPLAWLSLFDSDPAMLEAGTLYLHRVGPVYGVFGLGMGLYFASQGAGRLLWPWLANMGRLVVAAGGGWLALRFGGGVSEIFLALAVALGLFGIVNAAAIASGAWFTGASGVLGHSAKSR